MNKFNRALGAVCVFSFLLSTTSQAIIVNVAPTVASIEIPQSDTRLYLGGLALAAFGVGVATNILPRSATIKDTLSQNIMPLAGTAAVGVGLGQCLQRVPALLKEYAHVNLTIAGHENTNWVRTIPAGVISCYALGALTPSLIAKSWNKFHAPRATEETTSAPASSTNNDNDHALRRHLWGVSGLWPF